MVLRLAPALNVAVLANPQNWAKTLLDAKTLALLAILGSYQKQVRCDLHLLQMELCSEAKRMGKDISFQ